MADLVAFVKPADLPPSLQPFVKSSNKEDENIRYVIFKIRGTVDSYYGLTIDKDTGFEKIEQKVNKDLVVVRLDDEAQKKLQALLRQFQEGQFAHYLSHQVHRAKYLHGTKNGPAY